MNPGFVFRLFLLKPCHTDPNSTTPVPGGWMLNSAGFTGLTFSQNGGASWGAGSGTTPAFRVNGVVPEPGTAAALLGVLAAAASRWRGWRSAG